MKLFTFGSSHLRTTRIGLGLAALGRPGYINLGHSEDLKEGKSVESMQTHSHNMLTHAYDRGIRYFDVARSYGLAEDFIGNWLTKYTPGNDLAVGSKWGYIYTADWEIEAEVHEIKEHSLKLLDHQWEKSVSTLKRNPDIYHIHSATMESGVLEKTAVLDRLWELKDHGIIIGLSLSGVGQFRTLQKALSIHTGADFLFGSVQATLNIFEHSTESLLRHAHEHGMGIIVKEAVANGRLTERNSEVPDQLIKICNKYDTDLDALAIAYVLSKDWVNIVLSGASTVEQMDSNLNALELELSVKDLASLDKFSETTEIYWDKRKKLSWN